MYAEYPSVHNCCEREVVENFATVPPDIGGAVLALAFVVEPINLRNLSRLMVASDESDTIRVPYFVCEEQEEGLDGVVAAVDEVACVFSKGSFATSGNAYSVLYGMHS